MTLPSWPYIFVTCLTIMLIGVWAVAQTSYSHAMCEQTGFPQPANKPLDNFFYLFANKEGIYGLILISLQLAGQWRAVGIVLACLCLGGAGDMYLSMTIGKPFNLLEAFQAHGSVTVVGAWAAWKIIQEN